VAEAGPLPYPAAGPAPGGRCLLVDDDKVGALVSEHLLARIGFEVDRAGTCAEARAAMARTAYDAVVADYLLPDGTGPDLVDAHRGDGHGVDGHGVDGHGVDGRGVDGRGLDGRGGGRPPRFVALTANAEAVNASDAVRARFHAVLAKPTDMATLSSALRGGRPPSEPAPEAAGLAGLSESTVAAMAAAFRVQWAEFRACLAAMEPGAAPGDLAGTAHRLAGTTAQLGLCELEAPLRALERRCREEEEVGDLAALRTTLDRPLDTLPSWRRLALQRAHP
jgi:two-component system aerobic respiration control sensor histidine kinase ArcB